MQYQLTIVLSNNETVLKTVYGKDPDDAIGQAEKIIQDLIYERLDPKLTGKVRKCRQAERGGTTCV